MIITYEEKQIEIITKTGKETVMAHVASNGLAYYPTPGCKYMHITWQDTHRQVTEHATEYTVGHVASGRAVSDSTRRFATPKQCEAFIQVLMCPIYDVVVDWHKSLEEISVLFQHIQPEKVRAWIGINATEAREEQEVGA